MCYRYFRILGIVLLLSVAGCSSDDQQQGSSADVGESYDIATLLANADPKKGEAIFKQCQVCHSLEQEGGFKPGPGLYGLFGRAAGTVPGFAYSEVMVASQVVWTPETMDHWLEAPAEFIPGNRMVFVGVKKPQDRANLIAYLQAETKAASGSVDGE